AIDDPRGLIITASIAETLFGGTDVIGKIISLDHQLEMRVAGVIEDVPANSHFNSDFRPDYGIAVIAPLTALAAISDFKMEGKWRSDYAATYVLLPEDRDQAWLQEQIDALYDAHIHEEDPEYISGLKVGPLIKANTRVWDSLRFPILETVQLLGVLILIIVCVNYTNLATAQSFGRTQEVGLRKTFGAGRRQLLIQFLLESLTIVAFAMLIALACVELLVPAYNAWTGKIVALDYLQMLPWLALTTITVGLLAGAYPAYMISRPRPIESLHDTLLKGRKGGIFRSFMIAAQFAISILILAVVMVIYFQNKKMQGLSEVFPKSQIVVLEGVDAKEIKEKQALLREELNGITGVQAVTYSSNVPLAPLEPGSWRVVTPESNDESLGFQIYIVSVDADYMRAYDIDIIAGRSFGENIAADVVDEHAEQANVVINQLAARMLGFDNDADAVGKSFHNIPDEQHPEIRQYTIVGLVKDQYLFGVHRQIEPVFFFVEPNLYDEASIRLAGPYTNETLDAIDAAWNRIIQDYPIKRSFLDDYLDFFFKIPKIINNIIALFAGIALSLALIGLFGLAAFMARRRTREIGMRKVMGANTDQLISLLIWQFSIPVMWSLLAAIPLAYYASNIYLDFFPERTNFVIPALLLASLAGVLTAWIVVAGHAVNIAKATPVHSLRYE
ncbi:MAG: ABC transporter permease, partial [Gammaproteobacteria bacterium]|nr:ABC transporter permease [Gammaproteobacteria bacterium]